jgi:hypothetical protein
LCGCDDADIDIMTPEEELSNSHLEYHWSPGTAGAQRLLLDFIENGRLRRFAADRAKTDRSSTSRLSPHIHFGEVSVRSVHAMAMKKAEEWGDVAGAAAVTDFLRQLGYREYSRYLSFHYPFTHERSLLEHLQAVPWRLDQALFKAWRSGTTGYPLVDAAMREVWSTGWMHNRMRVVAASFLVKNLLLPWQWGLKHYWDALLDADLECDALGWQYCAGCLEDAHPLSYVVNLKEEAKKFDPDGHYVRRWLPVLSRLPAMYIHAPWEAPPHVLADAGVELGSNYPCPIIDIEESMSALEAVVEVVQSATGSATATVVDNIDGGGLRRKGPFRPATLPYPSAAGKVWGGYGREAEMAASAVLPGEGSGGMQTPLPKNIDLQRDTETAHSWNEEVQSNVLSNDDVKARRSRNFSFYGHTTNEAHGADAVTVGSVPTVSDAPSMAFKVVPEAARDGAEEMDEDDERDTCDVRGTW